VKGTWTPGHRRVPIKSTPKPYHEHVAGVVTAGQNTLAIYEGSRDEMSAPILPEAQLWKEEEGLVTLLGIRTGSKGTGVVIDLTHLTEAELDALKEFVIEAIERSRPSVQKRDATAREAEANGDYSFERSNRANPKLVIQPRKS
jgi:hypothetical protein